MKLLIVKLLDLMCPWLHWADRFGYHCQLVELSLWLDNRWGTDYWWRDSDNNPVED